MNPFERVVVFPDREFHNRLATAQAVTDPKSPAFDDPDSVNLQASRTYAGASLFSDTERQQQQPQHVAGAIQTMTRSIGVGGPAGGGGKAAWVLQATPMAGGSRYLPYADLPGSSYSAINTPAGRPAVALQPAGLSYASNDANSVAPTLTALSPAAAAAAIDALQGQAWVSSPHAPPALRDAAAAGEAHLGNWWSTFWDWPKGAVATVTHVIVSVAEDVYVGIRVIVDGVAHVFQQIIRVIEDVASAIASFFVKLAKKLADVIEALSVVFHFDEVVKTQQFLLKEVNDRLFGVQGNPAYPSLSAAIKSTAIPKLDGFFERGEKAIAASLNTLADRIAGTNVGQLKGQGATAHTVYTLKPKGGGQDASHATRCSWALQKLKASAPAPTGGSGQLTGPGATGGGPLERFVDDFVARLGQDGNLAAQWQQVRQGFQTLGHATSAGDFLSQGVAELLRVLSLLLEGVLAVSNAFLDGFLGLIDALISTLFDPQTGWLTRPLDIPVLSWLYQKLFGQPLTVLNVIALVAAIPLTVVWRIVEGEWPSQSLASAGVTQLGAPRAVVKIMTVFNGIIRIVNGLVASLHDILSTDPGTPKGIMVILGSLRVHCGVAVGLSGFPLLRGTSTPSDLAWAGWAAALGTVIIGMTGFVVGFALPAIKYVASGVNFLLGIAGTAIAIAAFLTESKQRPLDDVGLAAGLAASLAFIVNPVKFVPEYGGPFVALMDVFLGLVTAALIFAVAVELP